MSAGFRAVQWNRYKLYYDAAVLLAIAAFVALFLSLAPLAASGDDRIDIQVLWMRAWGGCAFLLVTVILCIGPLARLDRRFLPLLYNRRHLGVITCGVAMLHAASVLDWYHAHGAVSPVLSLLAGNMRFANLTGFPFEFLGLAVLVLLTLMAASSHDFWLAFLTPPVWKALHMMIYPAYALLVAHVALGAMQSETSPFLPLFLGVAFALVAVLHLAAGRRERRFDAMARRFGGMDGRWLDVGPPQSIADGCARLVVGLDGERIAVFRDGMRLSALSNVCRHQNGPLGEGRIVDGLVTCPWHGFQYRLEDGCAPPPFTDRVATFRLRLANGIVQVDAQPLPPGTYVEPLAFGVEA